MFAQAWFWLMVAAVFFTMNTEAFSTNTGFPGSGIMGGFSWMGLIVWIGFALFFAPHWWEPLTAFGLGAMVAPIPSMISRHLTAIFGMSGMILAPLCIIVGYVVWF